MKKRKTTKKKRKRTQKSSAMATNINALKGSRKETERDEWRTYQSDYFCSGIVSWNLRQCVNKRIHASSYSCILKKKTLELKQE